MTLDRILMTTTAALALSAGAAFAQDIPATTPTLATAAVAAAPGAAQVVSKGDFIETARVSGQFKTFLKALDSVNLTGLLKSQTNLTVFAPTDAAFAALPAGELDRLMADKPALQKLLVHHIINARVDSTKIKGAKGPVSSVAADPIELDGSGEALKADNATIVQADIMTTTGVMHVVDRVLKPGAAAASTSGQAASTTATASVQNP